MPFSRSSAFKLIILVLFVAGATGIWYQTRFAIPVSSLPSSPILVEAHYSGGWPVKPEKDIEKIFIYENGEVYQEMRSGTFSRLKPLDSSRLTILRNQINSPDLHTAFSLKEAYFCDSSVDGSDTVLGFTLASGEQKEFSSCVYKFDYNQPLLDIISSVTE